MLIILRSEPLLFVHAPPVYVKVTFTEEESTSVFVMSGEETLPTNEIEIGAQEKEGIEKNITDPIKQTDPSIHRRVLYLSDSFRQQAYKPLQFVLEDETMTGTIDKVEGETVWVNLADTEDQQVAIEVGMIEEILWRGKPFIEN
ncbi:hypothetical protein FITA111629_03405 [Filibacter tadaridae]|uniref:Uncharacterized protein n=1 Tax=Filibacter tadaridae TaxID=2483811 RepID=A0A3P5XG05_9BACL|nr:hypothetical protein [Filibacter tadaridae]VDC27486.1 hypothetical protein FILTAD_01599 [Filibacter tadaridae]